MTNTRKQVLAEKFAAANKAAFKPRSDIEGLGRKLRAIMRKKLMRAASSLMIASASPMNCFAYPVRPSGLPIR